MKAMVGHNKGDIDHMLDIDVVLHYNLGIEVVLDHNLNFDLDIEVVLDYNLDFEMIQNPNYILAQIHLSTSKKKIDFFIRKNH